MSSDDKTHLEGLEPDEAFQRVNLPGPLAERFDVVGDLAGGAESDLLVVRPREGGATRVVKIYRLRLTPPSEDVRARIAATDAKHVVRVEPPETWRGVTYEVIEHCTLGSLRDLIDREGPRLPEGLVRKILAELRGALEHVHSPAIGLVHRDLKPANVLVRWRQPLDLVLADFGLSEIIGDHSRLFLSAKRTIAYAAPEATHGSVNRKSDWWAVGVCVAEMLIGEHPVLRHLGAGATEQSVSQWIGDRSIPLDGLQGRWQNLCAGLLTKEVDDRWGEQEVGRWLAGDNPAVRSPAANAARAAPGVAPFVFEALSGDGVEAYDDPRLLAAAFARYWDEALAIVAGKRDRRDEAQRLKAFVSGLRLTRAREILLDEGDDEARLVSLRVALDPCCEPVFRGVDLSGDRLRLLAASAAASDAAMCSALLDVRFLYTHAAQSDRHEWAIVDAQWLACVRYAKDQLDRLRPQKRVPALDDAGKATLRAQLLHAIIDSDAARRLQDAADNARQDEHARTQQWFRELADQHTTDRESLGFAYVLAALHPTATQHANAAKVNRDYPALPPPLPPPSLRWDADQARSGAIGGWCLSFVLTVAIFWLTGLTVEDLEESNQHTNAAGTLVLIMLGVGAAVGWVLSGFGLPRHWLAKQRYAREQQAFDECEGDRARLWASFDTDPQ